MIVMLLFDNLKEKIVELEKKAHEIRISEVQLCKMIDHTNLNPFATEKDIKKMVDEAIQFSFYGICVNPSRVALVKDFLKNQSSDIKIVSVIGFPLGATTSSAKLSEVRDAIQLGADEVDMVINIGVFKDGNYDLVLDEISKIVDIADNVIVKVIIETAYLTFEEIVKACQLAKQARAHFVKTSTGFGPLGATPIDVFVMRRTVNNTLGVKAAGGIRTYMDAFRMIAAGANRIGTSSGPKIVETYRKASETDFSFPIKSPEELCPGCLINKKKLPLDLVLYYESLCNSCR